MNKPSENNEAIARERVTGDILSGQLAPNAKLKIRDLCLRYGIGASPLREALFRLVPEGLVTLEHNKGFRVAALSLRELVEITEMRQIVEAEAFRRAIERGDESWEKNIVGDFYSLSKACDNYARDGDGARLEWERRHRSFHRTLVSACGNRKLLEAVNTLHRHLVRYRAIFLLTEMTGEELRIIHQELLNVALDRDLEAAAPLMRRHVRVNVDHVRAGINRNPSLREIIDDS